MKTINLILKTPDRYEIKEAFKTLTEIHAIVDRQAQRGAYRLAAVLNDIFKE